MQTLWKIQTSFQKKPKGFGNVTVCGGKLYNQDSIKITAPILRAKLIKPPN